MRITCFLFYIILISPPVAYSQAVNKNVYWQQQVNHQIDVSLNVHEHTLDGFERIEYINNSPDTLQFIWFHVWPNAYKNDQTAFSDQLLRNGNTKFYFSSKEDKGYINRLDFKVDDVTANIEDHPQHIDIIKLLLPAPLLPSKSIIITTPFHVKLPYNFSRSGYTDLEFHVTQWYPKPAVYDQQGWHPMPYLDQGEFYNEFGNYDVRISVPSDFVVAATGQLHDEKEKEWMIRNVPVEIKKTFKKAPVAATKSNTVATNPITYKTLHFTQNDIHDFAWMAGKNWIVEKKLFSINNKTIEALIYYHPEEKDIWKNSFKTIENSLTKKSEWIGTYPYETISIVNGSQEYEGGMEYPALTVISGVKDSTALAMLIDHEIGHNWFQAALANNERKQPWLDEGLNTYFDNRYNNWANANYKQKENSAPLDISRILFETQAQQQLDQPVNTSSEKFSDINYDITTYYKAAEILKLIEKYIGTENFNKGIKEYYSTKKFQHVSPADLQASLERNSGKNLDSLFNLVTRKGPLPGSKVNGWKIITPFDLNKIHDDIIKKNVLLISPALGINYYDKLMLGGLFTNYKLPPSKFQFFVAPMYSTGSGKFTGLGKINYQFFPNKHFRKIDLFINAASFSMNEFVDEQDKKTVTTFNKMVPGFRVTLKNKDPLSQQQSYFQFKSFIIKEDVLRFYQDTIFSGSDTTTYPAVRTTGQNRTLHQLSFSLENNRVLYPYNFNVKLEDGKDFIRSSFTANYFFNYNVKGGMNLRFFAGKFFYKGAKSITKQFATDRYHLNMTGPNGYEDYTYSNYFFGRNEFEGLASQQIMVRDGGFKVRTDLLADKTGKTDDWLMAMNFTSSVPDEINPLRVLPINIPLKLFADVGTYAGAWEKNSESDRFLFNAGLQVSLFKNALNIYMPVVYSNVYKNYIQSTIEKKGRFFKTISFSIDLSQVKTPLLSQWISL